MLFTHTLPNRYFFLLLLFFYSALSRAGGPLFVVNHTPATFANPSLVLHIDPGALGNRTNAQADALLLQAFSVWNNVATSSIQLSQGTDISQDINSTNFNTIVSNSTNNKNFIVYDSNGSIIDSQFGVGQGSNTVGFTATFIQGGQLVHGYSVITGKNTIPGFKTDNDMIITIAHELGHLVGLDHTQTNIVNNESSTGSPRFCTTRSSPDQYALMYPFICRTTPSLHVDDIIAVSALYPAKNIQQPYGEISGFFVDPAGHAIIGANIWAKNTRTGEAISTVSDYLKNNNGSFQLFVPAGNYTLHANSINPEFMAGSAVGPYATDSTGKSFQPPHPITPVSYQTDIAGNAFVISVGDGKIIRINFSSDGGSSGGGSSGGGQFDLFSLLFVFLSLSVLRRKLQYQSEP